MNNSEANHATWLIRWIIGSPMATELCANDCGPEEVRAP